ncbi:MAG TPA: hypothetical protein VN631_03600, partial [Negativicutes bacterium]|nr:hypothetical protein [Negativicutes bacterium]
MRYLFVLSIAMIVLVSPGYASAEIRIIAEPGVAPTSVNDVQQTVKMFTIVVKETMNASLDG